MTRAAWYEANARERAALMGDVGFASTTRLALRTGPLNPAVDGMVLAGGDLSYYLDEGGYVQIGDIAYVIGGFIRLGDDGISTVPDEWNDGLPYILPFNLTTKRWGTPVLIPAPDWAVEVGLTCLAAEGGYYGVINGKIYFGGGDGNWGAEGNGANGGGNWLMSYDPSTGAFEKDLARRPDGMDYGLYAVADGKLYTLLGEDAPSPGEGGVYPRRSMYVYDPSDDTWATHDGPPAGFDPAAPFGTTDWDDTEDHVGYGDMSKGVAWVTDDATVILWADFGIWYDVTGGTWMPMRDNATQGDDGLSSAVAMVDQVAGNVWVVGEGRDLADASPAGPRSFLIGTRVWDQEHQSWVEPTDGVYADQDNAAINSPVTGVPEDRVTGDAGGQYWGLFFDSAGTPVLLGGNIGAAIFEVAPVHIPYLTEGLSGVPFGDGHGRVSLILKPTTRGGSLLGLYTPEGALVTTLSRPPEAGYFVLGLSVAPGEQAFSFDGAPVGVVSWLDITDPVRPVSTKHGILTASMVVETTSRGAGKSMRAHLEIGAAGIVGTTALDIALDGVAAISGSARLEVLEGSVISGGVKHDLETTEAFLAIIYFTFEETSL